MKSVIKQESLFKLQSRNKLPEPQNVPTFPMNLMHHSRLKINKQANAKNKQKQQTKRYC